MNASPKLSWPCDVPVSRKLTRAGISTRMIKEAAAQPATRHFVIRCIAGNAEFTTPRRSMRHPSDEVDLREVRGIATRHGWEFDGSGNHACPECVTKRKTMTQTKKSPQIVPGDPPGSIASAALLDDAARASAAAPMPIKALADLPALRTPTPEQRRVIFRALDEAYDEPNKCYVPGFTDQTIADSLKFPRAWITERREADFGPAGADPAIAELRAELANLRLIIESHMEKAMAVAADLEKDGAALAKLGQRVDKLGKA